MKHIINKITSNFALFLVLITLFTISNNHKIKYHSYGSAIELTYIDDQDSINYFKTSSNPTMYTYFNNLNTCYGQNRCGTCSYIAMGMLLSYYDTFYDDYFIAENFDYQETPSSINYILDNSPGVRREDYTGLSDTITDYTNYFINHSSTHFMSYLLTLCMNSPINYYNQYNILFNTDYYSMIGALDFGQINSILNYYINMRGLNNSYSVTNQTINFSNITYPLQNSSVINFIINNLNNGYPVLVCTQPEYSVGHTQIVYSYTYTGQNGYQFISHSGLGNTCYFINNDEITEAYAIIPNTNTTSNGSNNYINFLNNSNNNISLTQDEYNILHNTKNMWYNYFRQNYYFNINNQITINQTQLSIYEIERIKFVGMEPQTIYLETCENYDTIFYGNEIINTDCYLRIFDDVNSDIESDYYNPNAWSRFSINSRINYTFNGTVYIEQQYNYFHIEIIDYLYAY